MLHKIKKFVSRVLQFLNNPIVHVGAMVGLNIVLIVRSYGNPTSMLFTSVYLATYGAVWMVLSYIMAFGNTASTELTSQLNNLNSEVDALADKIFSRKKPEPSIH